jgi:hypothetical protein
MSTIGEEIILKLLDLPQDQVLRIPTESKNTLNSIRASIYAAKKNQSIEDVFISSKGNVLTVSREKNQRFSLESVSIARKGQENESKKGNKSLSIEEKKEIILKRINEARNEILSNEALSEQDKKRMIEEFMISSEDTREFDRLSTLQRKKAREDKENGIKPKKKERDISLEIEIEQEQYDDSEVVNNYPDPAEELRKEMMTFN